MVQEALRDILQSLFEEAFGSVCHKMSNASITGNAKELCDEILALLGAGVSSLVHHLEDNRKGHPIVSDANGKYVDVCVAELPVCPVKRQRISSIYRYEL